MTSKKRGLRDFRARDLIATQKKERLSKVARSFDRARPWGDINACSLATATAASSAALATAFCQRDGEREGGRKGPWEVQRSKQGVKRGMAHITEHKLENGRVSNSLLPALHSRLHVPSLASSSAQGGAGHGRALHSCRQSLAVRGNPYVVHYRAEWGNQSGWLVDPTIMIISLLPLVIYFLLNKRTA